MIHAGQALRKVMDSHNLFEASFGFFSSSTARRLDLTVQP